MTTEVTTTVNIRKRGIPRKRTSTSDTGHVEVRSSTENRNGGDVAERTLGIAHTQWPVSGNVEGHENRQRRIVVVPRRGEITGHWRRQHPTELRIALRQSSIICQPVPIVLSCTVIVFSILSRGRCALHLAVLEALYIRTLDPELCVQKENVLSLQLFGVAPRWRVNNVTKFAHYVVVTINIFLRVLCRSELDKFPPCYECCYLIIFTLYKF